MFRLWRNHSICPCFNPYLAILLRRLVRFPTFFQPRHHLRQITLSMDERKAQLGRSENLQNPWIYHLEMLQTPLLALFRIPSKNNRLQQPRIAPKTYV